MLHLDHKIINWNSPENTHLFDEIENQDNSSPLSPVHDAPAGFSAHHHHHQPTLQHLNPHMALAEEKEAPLEIPQREEEEEDDSALSPPIAQQHQDASRQSTPLSELSPPPDDDSPDPTVNGAIGHESEGGMGTDASRSAEKTPAGTASATVAPTTTTTAARNSNRNGAESQADPLASSLSFAANGDNHATVLSGTSPSSASPTHPQGSVSPSPSISQDQRTSRILELNVDLLRICMFLQSKGFPNADSRFQQFSSRLQSNLAYLQSALEGSRSANPYQLPVLDPLPPTDPLFASNPSLVTLIDRIRQTYKDLPNIFAKDLARRQAALGITPHPVGIPSLPTSPPNHLKRERTEDASFLENGGSASKRRDTGEGKSVTSSSSESVSPPSFMHMGTKNNQGQMMMPPPHAIPGVATPVTITSPPANGPLTFSVPMSSPPSSAGASSAAQSHQQDQNQSQQHRRLPSIPPAPTPTPQTPSSSSASIPGPTNQHSPPSAQHQRTTSPASATSPQQQQASASLSSSSAPTSHLHVTTTTSNNTSATSSTLSSANPVSTTSTPTSSSSMAPPTSASSATSPTQTTSPSNNDLLNLNLPNLGINPSEAQFAAANRERSRQNQIRMAQQQQHAMRAAAGGMGPMGGTGMGGMMGMGGMGMGGNNMGMGGMNPAAAASMGSAMGMGNMGGLGPGMGVGGGAGVAGNIGMGVGMGDMLPPSTNPHMMGQQQQQQHQHQHQHQHQQQSGPGSVGMGRPPPNSMSPPNMNLGVNSLAGPSGMGMGGAGVGGLQGQTSGMGGMMGGGMSGMSGMMGQGTAGAVVPSQTGGGSGGQQAMNPAIAQQLYGILRNPNHPTMKYMLQTVPGFESMPPNQQMQRLMNARNAQIKNQEQQHLAAAGQMNPMATAAGMRGGSAASMGNAMQASHQQQHPNMNMSGLGGMSGGMGGPGGGMNMGGGMMGQHGLPGNVNTMSPAQSMMGMGGTGMTVDPRMMGSSAGLTPQQQQQRQMMLMHQQRVAGGGQFGNMGSGGGGGGGGSMMLSSQMMQERMRQQQAGQMSPPHVTSPLGADGSFPSGPSSAAMRGAGGSSIPGIARSTRSPTDATTPMTPRMTQQRMSSMGGQEDYQRILIQQQQHQAMRAMASGSPASFNQQMMGSAAASQQQQQLAAQMQQQGYGMSPPPPPNSAGAGMNSSPPTGGQPWGPTPSQGGYPFASSNAGDIQRHMSATPVPQQQQQQQHQQQQQMVPSQNNTTSPTDPLLSGVFDLFNWNG